MSPFTGRRFPAGGFLDLFVEEVVDDGGRGVEGAGQRVVGAEVGEAAGGAEGAEGCVEFRPVGAVAAAVDGVVEGDERRAFRCDPREDARLVVAAQVQVFEPHEVAVGAGAVDDGGHVGDARENGRDEAGGSDSGGVEGGHGVEAAGDGGGGIHGGAEVFVEGVDGEGDADAREGLEEVEVAQDEVALGGDADGDAAAPELFEKGAGAAAGLFERLVGVGDGADEDFLARVAFGAAEGRPVLDVHERAPRLGVPREALHERGVAVAAGVGAAAVGVGGKVRHRQIRGREDAFDVDVPDGRSVHFQLP